MISHTFSSSCSEDSSNKERVLFFSLMLVDLSFVFRQVGVTSSTYESFIPSSAVGQLV